MDTPRNDVNLHISAGTILKIILVGVCVYFAFFLRDILLIILTAIVIASAIEPATRWFIRHRVPRLPSVILIYFLVILSLAVIFYFLLPTLLTETSSFLEKINSIDITGALQEKGYLPSGGLQGISSKLPVGDFILKIRDTVASISSGFFSSVSAIFGGALSAIFIFVLSFYFAVQDDGVTELLEVIVPIKNKSYVIGLWKKSQKKIGLWLQGQLLLGLIIGVLDFLGLTILGIQHALLLAVLAAIFEIIPLFGPILAMIPAVAIAFLSGGLTSSIVVAGLYVIVQQFENHLIYPLVVNKVVGVSPILVIVSLLVGWELAGFLGVLLSVPVSAVFMEYFNDVRRNRQNS